MDLDIRGAITQKLGSKIKEWREYSSRRIYFSIDKQDVLSTVSFLFGELGLRFATASGTHTPRGFEILYHFSVDKNPEIYSVRVSLDDAKHPEVDSITPLFPGAEWIEREMWELLGINFKNHPNLKKLLLPDDWPGDTYPLRHEHDHRHGEEGHTHES